MGPIDQQLQMNSNDFLIKSHLEVIVYLSSYTIHVESNKKLKYISMFEKITYSFLEKNCKAQYDLTNVYSWVEPSLNSTSKNLLLLHIHT